MNWDGFFYPHKVTVQSRVSSGGMGSGFGSPYELSAEVRDEQRMVRTTDGSEVLSSTQVIVPLGSSVPLGSLVTVWPGSPREREAEVLAIGTDDNGDADLDSFLILSLT